VAKREQRVGFVGVGSMGKRMATNVLKAGFPLAVYDIAPEPVQELAAMGAEACSSGAEVGQRSEVVVLMTSTYPQAEAAVLGPKGILEGISPGSTLIVTATIGNPAIKRLADGVLSKGVRMLDSPVSGGITGAAAGTLTLAVGGPPEVL